MPTNQQRREAAKRKLERQQQRREEQARRRRKIGVIIAAAAVVALLAAVLVVVTISRNSEPAAAAAACTFPPDTAQPAARPVSPPSTTDPPKQGSVTVTLNTNQGPIPLTLDRAKAPCTVESFVNLAGAGFFTGTPCHRLTTTPPLQVLQCGDPTGTGRGGPGYFVPDEPPTDLAPAANGTAVYPRGVVAMANKGTPTSGGSQFFLVYANSQLPPDYTVFGTIGDAGLAVLDKVAAGGDDGSFAATAGGGAPKIKVTIDSVTAS